MKENELFKNLKWKLAWLASYPKSGNTWFRIFLTNYLRNAHQPAVINELEITTISSNRSAFDFLYGIDSSDLTFDEIDIRRPAMYDHWQLQNDNENRFHKVHDAYTYLPDHNPLLGNPQHQVVIYIVRNPLDVAVSFAHHKGHDDIEKTINNMGKSNFSFCGEQGKLHQQLRQTLCSWSEHVLSWQRAPLPKVILRYEDMLSNPLETFTSAIQFLGLPTDSSRIQRALDFSSFEILQQQENQLDFKEKAPKAKSFFRRGQANAYKDALSEKQISRIIQDHGAVMKQFGYET